jgi:hypothetical protein
MLGIDFIQYWENLFKHDSTLFKYGDKELTIDGDTPDFSISTDGKNLLGMLMRFKATVETAGGGTGGATPSTVSSLVKGITIKGKNHKIEYKNARSIRFICQIFTNEDRSEDETTTAPSAGASATYYATLAIPGCFMSDDSVSVSIKTGSESDIYGTVNDTTVTDLSVAIHKILTDDPVPMFEIQNYNEGIVVGDSPLQLIQNKSMLGYAVSNLGADTYIDDIYVSDQDGTVVMRADYQALKVRCDETVKFTRSAGYIYDIFENPIDLHGKSSMIFENVHTATLTPDILLFLVPGRVETTPVGVNPLFITTPASPGVVPPQIPVRTKFYVGGSFGGAGNGAVQIMR